jgi:hypothetical protein
MPEAEARRVTVFYSWQSDRERKACKDFIRIAADDAAAAVSAKLNAEVRIDSDTEGVAGTPPISETILRKIDECDLFLADVTFVAATGDGKLIPNPNVMGEYGYALRAKGPHRILLAMNTAFGPPKELPFDLHHLRHPADYGLEEGATDSQRRSARAKFTGKLEGYLELAVREVLAAPAASPTPRWEDAHARLAELYNSQFMGHLPVVVSSPKLVVHVVPLAALDHPPLSTAKVKAARPRFAPSPNARIQEGQDENQWWTYEQPRSIRDKPNPESDWSFRLARPGLFQVAANLGRRIDDDPDIPVQGQDIEALLVTAVDRIALAAKDIGLAGPALVSASLEGLDGVEIMRARPGRGGRRIRKPSASLGFVQFDDFQAPAADQLYEMMERMWLVGGWEDGSPFFADGHWTGYEPA